MTYISDNAGVSCGDSNDFESSGVKSVIAVSDQRSIGKIPVLAIVRCLLDSFSFELTEKLDQHQGYTLQRTQSLVAVVKTLETRTLVKK